MRQGFIDIHTHILPGLDDGAADWEQTGEMLRLQREQGVTDIIATPHFDMERNYQDPEQIRELVARCCIRRGLQRHTGKDGFPPSPAAGIFSSNFSRRVPIGK